MTTLFVIETRRSSEDLKLKLDFFRINIFGGKSSCSERQSDESSACDKNRFRETIRIDENFHATTIFMPHCRQSSFGLEVLTSNFLRSLSTSQCAPSQSRKIYIFGHKSEFYCAAKVKVFVSTWPLSMFGLGFSLSESSNWHRRPFKRT